MSTAMPPPSSGGVTLAMISHIVERYDLPSMPWHGAEELHYVFEAMRRQSLEKTSNQSLLDRRFVVADEVGERHVQRRSHASQQHDRSVPFTGFELCEIALRHAGRLGQRTPRHAPAFARLAHALAHRVQKVAVVDFARRRDRLCGKTH